MYFLIFLSFSLVLIYILDQDKLSKGKRIIFKMLASLSFLSLAIVRFIFHNECDRTIFILMGLSFGVLGDLLLGIHHIKSSNRYLILGSVSFLLGHIFYLIAFFQFSSLHWIIPLLINFFILYAFHYCFIHKGYNFGPLQYPFYLYLFILSYLTLFSILNLIYLIGFETIGNNKIIWYPIGFLLFLISDLLLSTIYFKKLSHKQYRRYRFISTAFYYGAQLVITFLI